MFKLNNKMVEAVWQLDPFDLFEYNTDLVEFDYSCFAGLENHMFQIGCTDLVAFDLAKVDLFEPLVLLDSGLFSTRFLFSFELLHINGKLFTNFG